MHRIRPKKTMCSATLTRAKRRTPDPAPRGTQRKPRDARRSRHFRRLPAFILAVLLVLALGSACRKETPAASSEAAGEKPAHAEAPPAEPFAAAFFIPGFVEGSPNYEMLVKGGERAAAEASNVTTKVVEAGFNAAEWEQQLTSLAASGEYDVIVTSNPAMPAICAAVASKFPLQKFIVIDGFLEGNPQIHTVIFNQVEQGYLVGYMAGLITTGDMPGANRDLKVGLIAGQQYPVMDQAIRPGFEMGLHAVDPDIRLDFRVVGNWYDAGKASNLASSMFDAGVDAILVIAGSAAQGVLTEARERGRYVLWFDSNGYDLAPGTVVGSSAIHLADATAETLQEAIGGTLSYGTARKLDVRDGYIEFITDDPLFRENVPEELQEKMDQVMARFRSGDISFAMPGL